MEFLRRLTDKKLEKRFNYLSSQIGSEIHWVELNEEVKRIVRLVGIRDELLDFAGVKVSSFLNRSDWNSTERDLIKTFFKDALGALSHIIHSREQFVEVTSVLAQIVRSTKPHAKDVFRHEFLAVRDMMGYVEEFRVLSTDLIEITNAVKYHLDDLFGPGFAAVRAILRTPGDFQRSWPDIVELAKAAGNRAAYVFKFGLPTVAELIPTSADFRGVGDQLVAMAQPTYTSIEGFFEYGLPSVWRLFETSEERRLYWPSLLDVKRSTMFRATEAFRYALPALRHTFRTPSELKQVGAALSGMEGVPEVLQFGLPAVSHVVHTPEQLMDVAKQLREIASETRNGYLLEVALPSIAHVFHTLEELRTVFSTLTEVLQCLRRFYVPGRKDVSANLTAQILYHNGVPAIRNIVRTPEDLRQGLAVIIDMAERAPSQAGYLVHALPAVQHCFHNLEELKAVVGYLAEIANASGDDCKYLLDDALSKLMESFRTPDEFGEIGRRLLQGYRQLSDDEKILFFWYGLPSVAKFIDSPWKLTEYWNLLLTITRGWGPAHAKGIFEYDLKWALAERDSPAELAEYQKVLARMVERNAGYLTWLHPSEFPV